MAAQPFDKRVCWDCLAGGHLMPLYLPTVPGLEIHSKADKKVCCLTFNILTGFIPIVFHHLAGDQGVEV